MDSRLAPSVSVVVCTRNRADQLATALNAILASTLRDFELIVVDQSDGDETGNLVQRLAATDGRLRLIRDTAQGASRARNTGAGVARGELLIFTDDDCEPAPDWLATMVGALREDPGAGIAFGAVIPAPTDPSQGFIVGYLPPRRQRLSGRLAKLFDGGIGANMAVRRQALIDLGGLDEMLGPGSYFPSCEEGDLAYRVLAAGYALLHVPEARVVHHGLRDWQTGSSLTRRTYMAVAATYTKHARLHDPVGVYLVSQQIALAGVNVLTSLVRARRPIGLGRLAALFVGVWRSFELEVEPRHALYRPRS